VCGFASTDERPCLEGRIASWVTHRIWSSGRIPSARASGFWARAQLWLLWSPKRKLRSSPYLLLGPHSLSSRFGLLGTGTAPVALKPESQAEW